MATTKFVKIPQTLTAVGSEIDDLNTDVVSLRSLLHAHWLQQPLTAGQTPRTVKMAITNLTRDVKILQALAKYKPQQTDESEYGGKRPYKRLYINKDEVKALRNATPGAATAFGCEWRLPGIRLNDLNVSLTDGTNSSHASYSAATNLRLSDYDGAGSHQLYQAFPNHFRVEEQDFGIGTSGWTNTSTPKHAKVVVQKSGRYLVTARLRLRLLTKSKSLYAFGDASKIEKVWSEGLPNVDVDKASFSEHNADRFLPHARIKVVQHRYNETTSRTELKNTFYSGRVSIPMAGLDKRSIIAGFTQIVTVAAGDTLEFALERSHNNIQVLVSDIGSGVSTIDALAAIKDVDSQTHLPNRDKSNYIEITRISDVLVIEEGDSVVGALPPAPVPPPVTPPPVTPPVTPPVIPPPTVPTYVEPVIPWTRGTMIYRDLLNTAGSLDARSPEFTGTWTGAWVADPANTAVNSNGVVSDLVPGEVGDYSLSINASGSAMPYGAQFEAVWVPAYDSTESFDSTPFMFEACAIQVSVKEKSTTGIVNVFGDEHPVTYVAGVAYRATIRFEGPICRISMFGQEWTHDYSADYPDSYVRGIGQLTSTAKVANGRIHYVYTSQIEEPVVTPPPPAGGFTGVQLRAMRTGDPAPPDYTDGEILGQYCEGMADYTVSVKISASNLFIDKQTTLLSEDCGYVDMQSTGISNWVYSVEIPPGSGVSYYEPTLSAALARYATEVGTDYHDYQLGALLSSSTFVTSGGIASRHFEFEFSYRIYLGGGEYSTTRYTDTFGVGATIPTPLGCYVGHGSTGEAITNASTSANGEALFDENDTTYRIFYKRFGLVDIGSLNYYRSIDPRLTDLIVGGKLELCFNGRIHEIERVANHGNAGLYRVTRGDLVPCGESALDNPMFFR